MLKQKHDQVIQQLIRKIEESNISAKFIVQEWGTRNVLADIVIMDENYLTPVAIFEVKVGDNTNYLKKSGVESLRKIAATLKINVKCFLALDSDNDVKIFDVSKLVYTPNKNDLCDDSYLVDSIPDHKVLQNDLYERNEAVADAKKQEKQDLLNKVCLTLFPIYGLLFLVLDYRKIYTITIERLCFIGMITIVILLPFFTEIKIGSWIYLKRENKKMKKND